MLFNSAEYLLALLPAAFIGYFLLGSKGLGGAKLWLVIVSLFFYGWWNPAYLGLLGLSIAVNFWLGTRLFVAATQASTAGSKLLMLGLAFNLGLLAWFKYAGFAVESANALLGARWPVPQVALPLAVSFFTFTQLAYLVDCRRKLAGEYSFSNYVLFVTFFPHLIAGPILHHKDMIPQFERKQAKHPDAHLILCGLIIFAIGLFKKTCLADGIQPLVAQAFGPNTPTFDQAWIGALAYTFQLYFDFSGYSDMAIGMSLMFGIFLPLNFNSPYKATSIIDFWRRWHMTLSQFLRDYLYIPLGGNRHGSLLRYTNLMITMLLGGLWHGAAWTFVVWGALHGAYLCVNHAWNNFGPKVAPRFERLANGAAHARSASPTRSTRCRSPEQRSASLICRSPGLTVKLAR